jgi:23S rRNA pseudouridine1911/1915/1917 synthase
VSPWRQPTVFGVLRLRQLRRRRFSLEERFVTDPTDLVFRVLPRQEGETIASAMRQWLPDRSWSEIRRLLKGRRVMLSGNLCDDSRRRLRRIDVVKVLQHPIPAPVREHDVRVRHLDTHIVVVEKPAGMTSTRHDDESGLPARKRQLQPTLDEMLPRVIAKIERGNRKNAARPIRAVHRLDRETSGLMVFARTVKAQQHLEQQFRRHTIHRRYLAVVEGEIRSELTIESRLVRDRGDGRRGSTTLPDAGKRAVTHVRPVERLGGYTLIECRLETGRTHQIRIHLAESGHPLCGDKVYRQPLFRPAKPDRSGAARLALCAVELGFVHPATEATIRFEMPLSDDLTQLVACLRANAKNPIRKSPLPPGEG